MKDLASLGKTVLLTTHYMDEAQHLADRVAVIAGGRIVATGPPATLADRDQAKVRIRYRPPADAGRSSPSLPGLDGERDADGFVVATVDDVPAALRDLSTWALAHGDRLDGLEVTRPTLEDIYLSLIANETKPGPP